MFIWCCWIHFLTEFPRRINLLPITILQWNKGPSLNDACLKNAGLSTKFLEYMAGLLLEDLQYLLHNIFLYFFILCFRMFSSLFFSVTSINVCWLTLTHFGLMWLLPSVLMFLYAFSPKLTPECIGKEKSLCSAQILWSEWPFDSSWKMYGTDLQY